MFTVRAWDGDKILSTHKTLAIARRHCRGEGHTGEQVCGKFVPIAYVANDAGECVYNPRFKADISPAVGSAFTAIDNHAR